MTSPNHIIGGIAITGISLSFWDINIFSSFSYLSVCIISSILPDIDHTKSIIGKIFFPLAKFLDKKFGHRTITHSLTTLVPLFIFFLFIELNIINPFFNKDNINYSLIFLFAYLSHLILDMLTIQGIPLFYPFLRNPCVIPANPSLRFKSGNIKSEALALFLFTFVLFSSYDLFKNGFWTTYNRTFGTIKHAFREFKESETIVHVDYEYTFNGEKEKGFGYILEADKNSLEIWTLDKKSKEKVLIIDSKDLRFKNIKIQPKKTKYIYKIKDFNFFNYTLKEVNDSLNNKVISGQILSSDDFIVNNKQSSKGSIKLNKEIYPSFSLLKKDTIKKYLHNKIAIKKARLQEIKNENEKELNKLFKLKNELHSYKNSLKKTFNIYERNKFENLIIKKQNEINRFSLNKKSTNSLIKEIEILKKELNSNKKIFFSGSLKIFVIPQIKDELKLATK